jgi:hypothetical protein
MAFRSLLELYDYLPENEVVMVDILRQILIHYLPDYCKEKLSFGVPYFYGKKGICIVWPASVKGGGIRNGVLLGFMYGYKLSDPDGYLTKGTNKKIYYKIFKSPEQIDELAISILLAEAIILDNK